LWWFDWLYYFCVEEKRRHSHSQHSNCAREILPKKIVRCFLNTKNGQKTKIEKSTKERPWKMTWDSPFELSCSLFVMMSMSLFEIRKFSVRNINNWVGYNTTKCKFIVNNKMYHFIEVRECVLSCLKSWKIMKRCFKKFKKKVGTCIKGRFLKTMYRTLDNIKRFLKRRKQCSLHICTEFMFVFRFKLECVPFQSVHHEEEEHFERAWDLGNSKDMKCWIVMCFCQSPNQWIVSQYREQISEKCCKFLEQVPKNEKKLSNWSKKWTSEKWKTNIRLMGESDK
jgi:hypothetical protein